ncbi:TonB-dependent receptor, partial [Pseudomonas aeruginosa]|nr:TonB-dependent receptor [Pseudomonas aeruginosa]
MHMRWRSNAPTGSPRSSSRGPPAPPPPPPRPRNRTELEVKALYAFDTIALDERWDLSLGLRYD